MRIAIVDDNFKFMDEIEGLTRSFFAKKGENVQINKYSDGNELCKAVSKSEHYDLFLLDVEMPEMDGMSLAEQLKEKQVGARIVFITSHEKYAFKSIKLRTYYYILKTEYKEELPGLLERIYREDQENAAEYAIRDGHKLTRFKVKDIRYLTKDGKYSIFHCGEREASERLSLEEVHKRLPQEMFFFIGRGLIINAEHVVNLKGHAIEITGGEVFRISRFYYPSAMEVLTNYLGLR